jgi:hypothetical protein
LTKPERRYCVTRKELLAVVFFVKHFTFICPFKFSPFFCEFVQAFR